MKGVVYIYSLQCPDTFEVRYIGATIYINNRYDCHLRSPKYVSKPLQLWIADLLAKDKKPVMSILYTCSREEMSKYEFKFYEFYKVLGCQLLNEKGFTHAHDCIDTRKLRKIIDDRGIKIKDIAINTGLRSSSISLYLRRRYAMNIEKAKVLNDYLLNL